MVRTRYAPSPTGQLHIGGARTALFNFLLAKHYNGKFILRIEDTDQERNIKDNEIDQENELKFLDIFPDESFNNPGSFGPYKQSQKKDRYIEIAEGLVKKQKAYYCFCSSTELQESRDLAMKNNSTPIYSKKCRNLSEAEVEDKLKNNTPYTVRLKTDIFPTYSWKDLVRGEIVTPSSSLSDCIILRTNKTATYNFAVVVDDYDMEITHILRGEEHVSNTPYQIAAYHALGYEESIPEMGHLSMIVNQNREKLSKRNSQELHFVSTYRNKGYFSPAIANFLVLLGWSYKEEEIFNSEELIQIFNVNSMSSSPSIFNVDKLNWVSHKYFQNMDDKYFLNFINKFFDIDLGNNNSKKDMFALLNKDRIVCATELNQLAQDYFAYKDLTPNMIHSLQQHHNLLKVALDKFPSIDDVWDITTIRSYLKQIKELTATSGANLFKPLRMAFHKEEEGMGIQDVLLLNGQELSLKNLKYVLEKIK